MSATNQPRDLERRLRKLEDAHRRTATAAGPTLPFQVLPDGRPHFSGGIVIGSGVFQELYEPFEIPAPTGLNLTWGSSFDTIFIDASWLAAVTPAANAISGYTVQAVKQGSVIPIEVSVASGQTSTRIQPVEPNTTYTVKVFALSKMNRNGLTLQGTITTGGDTSAPAAPTFPTNPVLSAIEGLAVKWNANTERDVANGAGQYRLIVSVNANLSAPVVDMRTSSTQQFVTGLTGGQNYYVGLYAIDSSGNQSPIATPPGGPWQALQQVTTDVAILEGGGNVLKNSGFEDVFPNFWGVAGNGATITKVANVPGEYHGAFGIGAVKITGTGDAYVYEDLVLTKGTYVFSAWTKGSALTGAGVGACINYEPLTGTTANSMAVKGTDWSAGRTTAGKGTFDWTRLATRFEVTSTSANIRFYLQRGVGSISGTAWYDEVQVEAGKTLTSYAPRPDEINSDSISAVMIQNDSITTPKLAAFSVVAGKVAANTIGAAEIIAASITGNKIAASTITGTNIAGDTITGNNIVGGTITGNKIAANTIIGTNIAGSTIIGDNLVATLSIIVGKAIQSTSYNPGVSGWRIDGSGNAELNAATVRGSTWIGGTINIANRILASPVDESIHLSGNTEVGSNFSGTVYSGNRDWGLQIGSGPGTRWTHVTANMPPGSNFFMGFFDYYRNRRTLFMDANGNWTKSGPDGSFFIERTGQATDWGTAALILKNDPISDNFEHNVTAISWHNTLHNVATILRQVGSTGIGLECRDAAGTGWAPLRASQFLSFSSEAGKQNIRDLGSTTAKALMKLRPVKFKRPAPAGAEGKANRTETHKANEDADFYGFVAEEVAKELPAVAGYEESNGAPIPDSIDLGAILALTVAHNQELEKRLSALETVKSK